MSEIIESLCYALVGLCIATVFLKMLRSVTRRATRGREVVVLRVDGTIRNGGGGSGDVRVFEKRIESLEESKPAAVIVRINSPGGTVAASQAMHAGLRRLQGAGIRVVALMEDVAASGGVYVSMGAEEIIAHPGTVTGSIGVIMGGYNIKKLLDRIGVDPVTVTAGKFKDIMSRTKDMTDEEKALLNGMLVDTHSQFKAAIMASRGLSCSEVDAFADGRIMTGMQALHLRLIDACGTMHDAVRSVERLLDIEDGTSVLREIQGVKPLAKRLGLSFASLGTLNDRVAAELSLDGQPLWLMRRH